MLAASPAPDSTMTEKPSFESFFTASGTVATRFSPGKTSLGTPITCAVMLFSIVEDIVAGSGAPCETILLRASRGGSGSGGGPRPQAHAQHLQHRHDRHQREADHVEHR